ncbi:MAG: S41 family peptidase, partial [Mucilaginibacter sp.]
MLFKVKNIALLIPICITGITVLNGCKKEDKPGPVTGPATNTEINTWIKDSLDRYYYWADKLPANTNTNLEPIPYFNSIINSADRFSFITLPGTGSSLTATSRSKYGFDYLIFTEPASNRVLGLITLVMNTSPAKGAGLRRGQYFTKINGTLLTETNIDALKEQLLSQNSVKLSLATVEGDEVKETGAANITAGETFEQTAVQGVFTAGSKKIAYLFLTGYVDADREAYLTVFADYKAAGVTDMILDLRYNSGGDVSAAAAMCSMLAPGITGATPFIEYRGNKNAGTRKETFSVAATVNNGPAFTSLQQHNLNLSKLYVLTTGATASAAELMINNLKPYMTIVQIGQATRGKDEASIAIT